MKNKTLQDYFEKWATLLDSGNSEAIEAFIPDATHECYRQGHTYFERGSFQEAAEFFQYVSVLDPKYPDIYYRMGRAFYKSNNKYQAYIAFKNAIQLRIFNPDYKDASNNMKQVRKDLGIEEDSSNNSDFQIITASISSSYYDDRVIVPKHTLMLLGRKFQEYDEKFERYGEMLQCVETRVSFLEEMVRYAKVDVTADINKNLINLEKEDSKLLTYYKNFYWPLQSMVDACSTISSGIIAGDGGQVERLSTTTFRKILCYFLDILSGIPLYGCLIGAAHDAFDNLHNTTLAKTLMKKVHSLHNIIKNKFNSKDDITKELQQLAIIFTHLKKEEILEPPKVAEKNSTLKDIRDFLAKKLLPLQQKIQESVPFFKPEDEKDPVANLAFQDITFLISYLYDNSEAMVKSQKNFIKDIIGITKEGKLPQIWLNKIKNDPPIAIEYELSKIESKVSPRDIKVIHQKTLEEKWLSTPAWLSWTGISRGVEYFLNESYIQGHFNPPPSDKQINDFRIFIFQEMCKTIASNNTQKFNCLKEFKEKYPDVVKTVRESLPWLFKKEEIVEIFVDDEPTKSKIIQMLSQTEPKIEKFFMKCVDEALIADDFSIPAQPNIPYQALGESSDLVT